MHLQTAVDASCQGCLVDVVCSCCNRQLLQLSAVVVVTCFLSYSFRAPDIDSITHLQSPALTTPSPTLQTQPHFSPPSPASTGTHSVSFTGPHHRTLTHPRQTQRHTQAQRHTAPPRWHPLPPATAHALHFGPSSTCAGPPPSAQTPESFPLPQAPPQSGRSRLGRTSFASPPLPGAHIRGSFPEASPASNMGAAMRELRGRLLPRWWPVLTRG